MSLSKLSVGSKNDRGGNSSHGNAHHHNNESSTLLFSKSLNQLEFEQSKAKVAPLLGPSQIQQLGSKAQQLYSSGSYTDCLAVCDKIYDFDAHRTDNLLLMGAAHFQLRNYSESVFFNQQCIRVDPQCAEAYSNLGNALKELGDLKGATQFYLKAIKLKPRFGDAYNNLASAYMLQGQIQQAMETYQMALVLNPQLVDAHTNLGNLHKARGDMESSKQCYLEAIKIKPDFPIAWNNLAGVFKEEGQLATAIAYYKEALRLCPEFADAHSNLGNALKEQGQLQDAIVCYQSAIKLRSDFAIAHGNLGSCYYDLGDFSQAVKCFNYAIQLEPNFPDAYNNLGNALKEEARLDEAINAYRAALHLKPDHPHAYNNLGNAMIDKGFIKEAIHCYVTAIRLMPQFSAAHSNLASVLKEQGKIQQAIAHYLEAIKIDPSFADAYSNLGNAYKEIGQAEQALACYRTAISLEPRYAEALSNLAAYYKDLHQYSLAIDTYRQALHLRPEYGEALANLTHCLVSVCNWSTRDEDFRKLHKMLTVQLAVSSSTSSVGGGGGGGLPTPTPTALPCVQPFHTLAYPLSCAEQLAIARKYAAKARLSVALCEVNFKYRAKARSGRIRVGFLSSDWGHHPVGHAMASLFRYVDRRQVEVFVYALTAGDGSASWLESQTLAEHWVEVSTWHAGEIASRINNDNVHVLVQLNGYTRGGRMDVCSLRPAPVQMAFLGFCGTTGADYLSYLIGDRTVIPPDLRPYYAEKILSLPHCYLVNDHALTMREVLNNSSGGGSPGSGTGGHPGSGISPGSGTGGGDHPGSGMAVVRPRRAQYGLSEDKFVFCCFSQLYKIDPDVFAVWMRILKRVSNSVLWLLRFPGEGEENLRREARAVGVPDDQLVFSDPVPRKEHVLRGYLADLFLDTPMCNAHTTACDILWSGTPMITMMGEKMASRVGASVLNAIGLADQCVCTSLEEYEELAVSLAEDSDRLYTLRQHLENTRQTAALFDTARWVRNFEQGLALAWKRHEAGLPPDHIEVVDDAPVFTVQDDLL